MGDIPIYVTYDSADVWCQPEFFKLNDAQKPLFVAGIPPDYFSTTGSTVTSSTGAAVCDTALTIGNSYDVVVVTSNGVYSGTLLAR